ncbi:penicillin-binding protein activator [Ferrimonas balearica]|uniref:penicillin-binding protein activator n=1 Tax=Ferrimonas balearica TaxID=44012 RepID=UPI001C99AEC1|nr:penicillin-binding protein activator [Ferrimonas balearica]MBY5992108.1 penicillin-binding protein activator [Ferrimonas balearica]
MKSVSLVRPAPRRHLALALLVAVLTGCAADPGTTTAPSRVELGQSVQTPSQYLGLANGAEGEARQGYLLLAARAYLNQGQRGAAQGLLDSLAPELPTQGPLQAEYRLLRAHIAADQQQREDALALLEWPSNWALSSAQWRDFFALRAELHQQGGEYLAEAAARYGQSAYLSGAEQESNYDALWLALSRVDEETLKAQQSQSREPQWRGWLELAWLAQHFAVQPSSLLGELARWQQANPSHPAAQRLPVNLERALSVQPYRPHQVAVLLPLSGRIANQARAIQDGLLANLLANQEERQVRFYDTGEMDAGQAYQQALEDGAEFIIGPLLKPNLDKVLALYDGQVPLLALNSREAESPEQPDLYFFSLDPEAEAAQAARKMWQQGHRHPMVLAAGSAIGKRMAERFVEEWQTLSDEDAEVHYFSTNATMRETVQSAMHVDQSQARIQEMKGIFGPRTQADFRSRRDVDALYLVANGDEVRLLKPFVDVSLAVFADPLALYASSRAHVALAGQQSQELDGLALSDMPWLINDNAQRRQAETLWPERQQALMRLYAMGYDSWSLIDRLAQMRVFTGYRVNGLSGQLTVTPDGDLDRELDWAKYRRGQLNAD